MNEKILTIIVPSYNTAKFVDECVPTFLNDKLFNLIDVVFIDDGATDNVEQKLRPFINKNPTYFHFVHKENGGHGSVINYGLRHCVHTKYFKVVDGDDYVDSDALLELACYLKKCDDDLIVSAYCEKYPDSEVFLQPLSNEINENGEFHEKTSYGKELLLNLNVTIHSSTYKTAIFVDNMISLPEKVFFEDNLYILYPAPFLKTISFVNCCVYYYRLGNPNQSVSIEGRVKHYKDSLLVRGAAHSYYDQNISKTDPILERFGIQIIARGLACYRNTILYYTDNKMARQKCLELYKQDCKYPLLIKEFKKSKFYRLLFFLRFRFIGFFRKKEIKSIH